MIIRADIKANPTCRMTANSYSRQLKVLRQLCMTASIQTVYELITYCISNNTFTPIDKSVIISISAHFL